MKKISAIVLTLSLLFHTLPAAADNLVKIMAVSKTTWKIESTEKKTRGTSGGGATAGAVGGLLWIGGPLALAGGALLGNHLEKSVRGEKGSENTTTEVVQGYRIKLNTGESIKTLVKYKVGQTLARSEILEEK